MKIAKDCAVRIHYHLTDDEGEVIDSSSDHEPLAYLHGHGNLVPGVENALLGHSAGEKLSTVVPPAEGYGEHDPGLDIALDLDVFPDEVRAELQPGLMFKGGHPTEEEQVVSYTIVEVLEDRVHATGNHELAGVNLHFDLEIVEVRAATAEELSHGHIHGPGGHHH